MKQENLKEHPDRNAADRSPVDRPPDSEGETGDGRERSQGEQPLTENKKSYAYTDLGNAERMADALKGQIAFCAPLGGWLKNAGERYVAIDTAHVTMLAIDVIREIGERASVEALGKAEYDRLTSWYDVSQGSSRINAMVSLAKSLLCVKAEQFDENPLLINLKNGVFDLERNLFRERTADDYFTRVAHVEYDPGATCPQWKLFIETILQRDPEYMRYLQKLSGTLLSGTTSDQAFYNKYGNGANGKTTYSRVMHDVLGDYAASIPTSVLLSRTYTSGPTPYLALLKDVRFVMATEFNEGDALDEARVKSLTGGEPITADAKHRAPITYIPRFKIFIATNHPLIIRGTDDGIWRRVRMMPFRHQFTGSERKDDFHRVLLSERNGILNWMLAGWRMYRAEGLLPPRAVADMTGSYRQDQDVIGRFLDECMQEAPQSKVLLKDAYAAFDGWCNEERITPMPKKSFSNELRQRGIRVEAGAGNQRYVFERELVIHSVYTIVSN